MAGTTSRKKKQSSSRKSKVKDLRNLDKQADKVRGGLMKGPDDGL